MSWNLLITFFSFYGASAFAQTEHDAGSDSSTVAKSCDLGWYSFGFGESCYKLEKDERTWSQAERQCVEYGGHLASIHTKELQEFLSSYLLMEARRSLWLGLHDQIRESRYMWSDGSEFDFRLWSPGEPTGLENHQEDCVEMYYRFPEVKLGKWNDVDCNLNRSFICQKERTNSDTPLDPRYCSVSNSGFKFQDSCFNIVYDKLSWNEAENYCSTHYSGHLVAVKDITVSVFMNYILRDTHENFWIGLKLKKDSTQSWSSGWYVSYTNWMHGNVPRTFENMCAKKWMHNGWTTDFCDKKLAFVCETSNVGPPTLTPAVPGGICPEKEKEWIDLGGDFCYYFETKYSLSWTDANFNCMQIGGYLASIHSPEESYVIQPFLEQTSRVHIGLYKQSEPITEQSFLIRVPTRVPQDRRIHWRSRRPNEGSHLTKRKVSDEDYIWADGTLRDYINWGENQPNGGPENCVDMDTSSMEWHDYECKEKAGYICSVYKVAPPGSFAPDEYEDGNNSISSIESDQNENSEVCSRYHLFIAVICILLCLLLLMIGFNAYYFKSTVKIWFQRKYASVLTPQKPDDDQKPNSCSAKFISHDSYVRVDNIS